VGSVIFRLRGSSGLSGVETSLRLRAGACEQDEEVKKVEMRAGWGEET